MLLYDFRSLNFYQINTVRGISYAGVDHQYRATNIAGFGGFLGAALRADFYHQKMLSKSRSSMHYLRSPYFY